MIVHTPALTPVTTPDAVPTLAIEILLLLHVPPPEVLVKVDVAPTQTTGVPPIAAGVGLTVSPVHAIQPVGSV